MNYTNGLTEMRNKQGELLNGHKTITPNKSLCRFSANLHRKLGR